MKKNIVLLIVLALSVLSSGLFAQKNGKPNPNTPVTSTIQDMDADSNFYSIRSDSMGSYQNGVNSVVSQIQGIGDWELSMLNSPNRTVYVNFDQPVSSGNPTPPANAFYPVRFITQCSTNLTTLTAGATQNCPLIVAINVGADRYSLRFYTANFPGTDNVGWTCNSASNGKCNSWTMQSNPGGNVAQLLKITTSKGKTVNTSYGFYNFNFSVNVSNP